MARSNTRHSVTAPHPHRNPPPVRSTQWNAPRLAGPPHPPARSSSPTRRHRRPPPARSTHPLRFPATATGEVRTPPLPASQQSPPDPAVDFDSTRVHAGARPPGAPGPIPDDNAHRGLSRGTSSELWTTEGNVDNGAEGDGNERAEDERRWAGESRRGRAELRRKQNEMDTGRRAEGDGRRAGAEGMGTGGCGSRRGLARSRDRKRRRRARNRAAEATGWAPSAGHEWNEMDAKRRAEAVGRQASSGSQKGTRWTPCDGREQKETGTKWGRKSREPGLIGGWGRVGAGWVGQSGRSGGPNEG